MKEAMLVMRVIDLLRGRRTGAPPPAGRVAGLRPDLPGRDDDEAWRDGDHSVRGLALFTGMMYVDAAGRPSTRRVTIRRIQRGRHGWLVNCHCHERRATRTFRLDRIRAFVDPVTGEVHEDVPGYLHERIGIDGLAATRRRDATIRLLATYRTEVTLMAYLAHCDGDYDSRERAIIARWLMARPEATGVNTARVAAFLAQVMPGDDSYLDALDDLADMPDDRIAAAVQGLVDVMNADGRAHEKEFDFMLDLSETLAAAGHEIRLPAG